MNKITLFVFASLLLTGDVIYSQGFWIPKANLGPSTSYGRSKGASFEINGLGYIGTGSNGTAKADLWAYDPGTNTWTQKANFGGAARYGAFGFAVNGAGYIGGGYAAPSYVKDVWKYDVAGNSWTQVSDIGGTGRMDGTSFVIGNRAYVGTGYSGSTLLKDFWQYNPTADSWLQKADYGGSPRSSATGFAVGGKGYICLGASTGTYNDDVYQYDTTANIWTVKTKFPGAAREGASAFVIGNMAFVGTGGSNSSTTLYNDFYRYDPAGDSWTPITNFSGSPRSHAVGFSIGNFGYVGTGYAGPYVNNFYQYDMCNLTHTVTTTNPSCNGGNNGLANVSVSGAINPLTYLWSNMATTQSITGLSAGNYSVVVTDGLGCSVTDSVKLTEPPAITDSLIANNISCKGDSSGTIILSATGGTAPLSYSWSNGSTSQNISGVVAGSYSVLITDSNGCTAVDTIVVAEPATALTLSVTNTPASCSSCPDGTASVIITGGDSTYLYAWSPTSQSTQTATGLLIGNYTICVTDSNMCVKCDTVTIGTNNSVIEYNPSSISIFPNPNKGEFKIIGLISNAEISVYNCLGEVVHVAYLDRKQERVTMDPVPPGIYLLYIKTQEGIFTKKLIISAI